MNMKNTATVLAGLRRAWERVLACLVAASLVVACMPLYQGLAYASSYTTTVTGAGTYTATAYDDVGDFVFTPDETALYSFSTTGSETTYSCVYVQETWHRVSSGVSDQDSGASVTALLTAGVTYEIWVEFYDEDEGQQPASGTIGLTVTQTAVTTSTLSAGVTRTATIGTAGTYALYTFTPTADATWRFYTGGDVWVDGCLYDSSWDVLLDMYSDDEGYDYDNDGRGNLSMGYALESGETYYVVLWFSDTDETGSFTVAAAKQQAISGASLTLASTSYAFTGDYLYPEVTVASGTTTYTEGADYHVWYTSCLYPGTAAVRVVGFDGTTLRTTFTITAPTDATTTYAGYSYSATLNDGDYALYSYTPTTSGTYLFSATASGVSSACTYDLTFYDLDDGESSTASGSGSGSVTLGALTLTAGTTYYVRLISYNVSGASFTFSVANTNGNVDSLPTEQSSSSASSGTTTVKKAQNLKIAKKAKTVKYKKLKKGAVKVKAITKVSGAKGKLSYAKVSVKRNGKALSTKAAKKIAVNKSTGKLTLKKGLAKGTYKVKVKVKAKATGAYKAASKTVTLVVKVK